MDRVLAAIEHIFESVKNEKTKVKGENKKSSARIFGALAYGFQACLTVVYSVKSCSNFLNSKLAKAFGLLDFGFLVCLIVVYCVQS